MDFWTFLRPAASSKGGTTPKPATADELRAALTEAEAEAAATEEAAAGVAQERAGLLLAADDTQLDEIDRRLQLAQRSADRTAAAVEALRQSLAEAEAAERQAELDKLFGDGQAALDRGLDVYRRYGVAAADLARLVAQLPIVAAEIEHANKLLAKAGDPRRVADLDETARPHRPRTLRLMRQPLWVQTVLPSGNHPYSACWPPYTHDDTAQPELQPRRVPPEREPYKPTPGMVRWPS